MVGAVNTGVGFGAIFGCMYVLGWSPAASNLTGYLRGFVLSFGLHRNVTFQSQGQITSEFKRYCLGVAIAYLANLVTLLLLIRLFRFDAGHAQVLAVSVYVITFYLLAKLFVFERV